MTKQKTHSITQTAIGIGLRQPHHHAVLTQQPTVDWFEVHSENFFSRGGAHIDQLIKIRQQYPISLHGVGLSLGSADGLELAHLKQLKELVDTIDPIFVSEHLSWSHVNHHHFNDLLPLPYTQESLRHFADNVKQTQDYLGRQVLIENPSSYIQFNASEIPEWEFYAVLPSLTGCALLFDVNNVYVNAHNHQFNTQNYLDAIKADDVFEIHLAGYAANSYQKGDVLIDDHGSQVHSPVWQLFAQTIDKIGAKPTLIEWDTNVPDLAVLIAEANKIKQLSAYANCA